MTRRTRPTKADRDALTATMRGLLERFGRAEAERGVERAAEALKPAPSPRQVEREQRRAASEAARVRDERIVDARALVYREMQIRTWIAPVPPSQRLPPLPVIRPGLAGTIRATLRYAEFLRSYHAGFGLVDTRKMRPAVDAIIAWERSRLDRLGRRLERIRVGAKAQHQPDPARIAAQARRQDGANAAVQSRLDARLRSLAPVLTELHRMGLMGWAAWVLNEAGWRTARGTEWRIDYVRTVVRQMRGRLEADPEFFNGLDVLAPGEWDAALAAAMSGLGPPERYEERREALRGLVEELKGSARSRA